MQAVERAPAGRTILQVTGRTGALSLLGTLMLAGGCGSFDTADYRPPLSQVRQIEPLIIPAEDATAQTQATTQVVPTTLPVIAPATERPVSLVDVRELALANNLDLKVIRLDPQIAAASLDAERAAFEALFTLDTNYANLDQPIGGRVLDGQIVGSQAERIDVIPGILKPLRTGGALELDLPIERLETGSNDPTGPLDASEVNYETDARATFTQPLGRNFGADANEAGIRIATAQLGQAQVRQKLQIINVLATADRTYWLLYAADRALGVRRQQYELAVQQLERVERLLNAGEQPEVELIRAQADVADALERVLEAENIRRQQQRQLKRLINAPDLQIGGNTTLLLDTLPEPVRYKPDPDRLVDYALTRRMELLEAELRIAEQTANVLAARNATLPLVDFRYVYNINGLGGDLDDSFEQLGGADFQDHTFGLSVGIPLGNRDARSRLRVALLRRLQELRSREARILEVRQEVADAADSLDTSWQRILAARRRVVLNARLLDAAERRFELGLATGLEVSEARAQLAEAQLAEIEAITDSEIARVDLAVATGTVIGKTSVMLDVAE